MQNPIYSLVLLLCLFSLSIIAQSPPELLTPIDYDSNPTLAGIQFDRISVAGIAAGFDNGRRNEEIQFGLPTNALGNLIMPTQADWDAWTTDEKVLFLLNEERTTRDGIDYNDGQGPVKGYPLTGIEANIDALAQAASSNFSISGFSGTIDADPNIGGMGCMNNDSAPVDCCHELLSPAQPTTAPNSLPTPAKGYSISSPAGTISPGIEVRAIYDFIYRFSGRLAMLIQDEDLNPMTSSAYGFDDNYGLPGEEGFLGVGLSIGVPSVGANHTTYLVVALIDPISDSEGCNYDCTTCNTCSTILVEDSMPIPDGLYQTSNWIETAGTVPSGGDVTMKAGNFVNMNPMFEVSSGGVYHAYIDDCFYTLD